MRQVLPRPKGVAGQNAALGHVEQLVHGVRHNDLRLADLLPTPLSKDQRLVRTVEFRDLIKLVDSERVRVIVVRVQAAGIEQRFRIFLSHRVGNRHSAAERVEAPAQVLTSTQIFDAEPRLVSEQPQKHRGRIPIPPNGALQNFQAELRARPGHGCKVHAPEARLFAHQQSKFVAQLDDVAVVWIVHEPDVIGAQRLDPAHVLFHLRASEREALILPHVVPADAVENDRRSV